MNSLERLTHSRLVLSLAHAFHVSSVLRKGYYLLAAPKDGFASLTIQGIEAQIPVRTSQELRIAEGKLLWEEDFLKTLIASLHPGDVFYDVGSHIGLFAEAMAKIVGDEGEVVAFEPERSAYERLLQSARMKNLSNIRVVNKALGEQDGTATLQTAGEESSLLPPLASNGSDGTARRAAMEPGTELVAQAPSRAAVCQTVEVVEGDGFRVREKIRIPQAVKIDVEGFEYFVLLGLQKTLADPACRVLCCEVHPTRLPTGVNLEALRKLIESVGFRTIHIHPRRTMAHLIAYK